MSRIADVDHQAVLPWGDHDAESNLLQPNTLPTNLKHPARSRSSVKKLKPPVWRNKGGVRRRRRRRQRAIKKRKQNNKLKRPHTSPDIPRNYTYKIEYTDPVQVRNTSLSTAEFLCMPSIEKANKSASLVRSNLKPLGRDKRVKSASTARLPTSRVNTAQSNISMSTANSRPQTPFEDTVEPSLYNKLDRYDMNVRMCEVRADQVRAHTRTMARRNRLVEDEQRPWYESDWFALFNDFLVEQQESQPEINWAEINKKLFPNEDLVSQKRGNTTTLSNGKIAVLPRFRFRPSTCQPAVSNFRRRAREHYLSKLAPHLREKAELNGGSLCFGESLSSPQRDCTRPFFVPGKNTINKLRKQKEMRDEELSIMLNELQHQLSEATSVHSPGERSSSSPDVANISQSSGLTGSWKFSEGVLDHSPDVEYHEVASEYAAIPPTQAASNLSQEEDQLKKTWSILPPPAEEVHLSNLPNWPRRHYKEL